MTLVVRLRGWTWGSITVGAVLWAGMIHAQEQQATAPASMPTLSMDDAGKHAVLDQLPGAAKAKLSLPADKGGLVAGKLSFPKSDVVPVGVSYAVATKDVAERLGLKDAGSAQLVKLQPQGGNSFVVTDALKESALPPDAFKTLAFNQDAKAYRIDPEVNIGIDDRPLTDSALLKLGLRTCGDLRSPAATLQKTQIINGLSNEQARQHYANQCMDALDRMPSAQAEAIRRLVGILVRHQAGTAFVAECTGSLVAPDRILTARHCVLPDTEYWFMRAIKAPEVVKVKPALCGKPLAEPVLNDKGEPVPPAAEDYVVLCLEKPFAPPFAQIRWSAAAALQAPVWIPGLDPDVLNAGSVAGKLIPAPDPKTADWRLRVDGSQACHVVKVSAQCLVDTCATVPGASGAPVIARDDHAAPGAPLTLLAVHGGATIAPESSQAYEPTCPSIPSTDEWSHALRVYTIGNYAALMTPDRAQRLGMTGASAITAMEASQ